MQMRQNETSRSNQPAIPATSSPERTIPLNDIIVADLHKAIECLSARDSEGHTQAIMHCLNALEYLNAMRHIEGGSKAGVRSPHPGSRVRSRGAFAAGPTTGESREQWMEALARSMDIALGVKHETLRLSFDSI
jgi:hypothetical protein